jgi:hypothetical protein
MLKEEVGVRPNVLKFLVAVLSLYVANTGMCFQIQYANLV